MENDYYLKISGTYGIANWTLHRDAAFELSNQEAACYYPWRWNGIPDGSPWDCARPIPDEYNSDHIYYYYFESDGTYSSSGSGTSYAGTIYEVYTTQQGTGTWSCNEDNLSLDGTMSGTLTVAYTGTVTPYRLSKMQEINPIIHKINDLRGRCQALRGHL